MTSDGASIASASGRFRHRWRRTAARGHVTNIRCDDCARGDRLQRATDRSTTGGSRRSARDSVGCVEITDDDADPEMLDELDLDAVERDLRGVEVALERLDDGTYWTDEVDGQPIPDDVLVRRPAAPVRVDAEEGGRLQSRRSIVARRWPRGRRARRRSESPLTSRFNRSARVWKLSARNSARFAVSQGPRHRHSGRGAAGRSSTSSSPSAPPRTSPRSSAR